MYCLHQGRTEEKEMRMRMSKSRMLAYKTCPYQFRLNYIEFKDDPREEPKEGSPLRKGSELHKIFEDYYDLPIAKQLPEPFGESIFEALISFPEAHKSWMEDKDPMHDNLYHKLDNYDQLDAIYTTHLENFVAYNLDRIRKKGIENYIPEYREFEAYDPDLHFIGIIDRAEQMPGESGYRVIDYKTGRPSTLKKYLSELALYQLLFEKVTGEPVYEVGVYFSEIGKERRIELDQDDFDGALNELRLIRENIAAEHFPRKRSYICDRFCDHKQVCDLDLDF